VKLILRQRVHEVPASFTQNIDVHGSTREKVMMRTRSYNKCLDREERDFTIG